MKQTKENWISARCKEIDCGIGTGTSKTNFSTLKLLTTQRQQTKTNLTENAKQSVNDGRNTARSCRLQFKKSGDDADHREIGDPAILEEEVEAALWMLEDGKSPGVDSIAADILKHGGPGIGYAMAVVCQKILTSVQWPKDRTKSQIIRLPKKGRATERSAWFVTLGVSCYG